MAKYKVTIKRVEYYSMTIVVDAKDIDEAKAKTQDEWDNSDYLYDRLQDCVDDSSTEFIAAGVAQESDINNFPNI